MPEIRTTAVAVRTEPARAWVFSTSQVAGEVFGRAGVWAADTAQQFGSVLAALMAPVVFCLYAFAVWSLASNLGWTDSFVFPSGALSNWLIWLGIAILVNLAATVLKRHAEAAR